MITFSAAVIADRLQALTRAIDADSPLPGQLLLLDASANVLASVPFLLPSSGGAADGELSLRLADAGTVTLSGTPASARIESGAGTFVASLDVGLEGSGAAVELGNLSLLAGGEVQPSLAALTEA